jgi:hypothetical protein
MFTNENLTQIYGGDAAPAPSYAIAEAPVQAGVSCGLCLLWPGPYGGGWVIGGWSGVRWHEEGGLLFEPEWFALSPAEPEPIAGAERGAPHPRALLRVCDHLAARRHAACHGCAR